MMKRFHSFLRSTIPEEATLIRNRTHDAGNTASCTRESGGGSGEYLASGRAAASHAIGAQPSAADDRAAARRSAFSTPQQTDDAQQIRGTAAAVGGSDSGGIKPCGGGHQAHCVEQG